MFNFQLGIFVNIVPLYLEAKNSTFANSGDPDEMLNFIRVRLKWNVCVAPFGLPTLIF